MGRAARAGMGQNAARLRSAFLRADRWSRALGCRALATDVDDREAIRIAPAWRLDAATLRAGHAWERPAPAVEPTHGGRAVEISSVIARGTTWPHSSREMKFVYGKNGR